MKSNSTLRYHNNNSIGYIFLIIQTICFVLYLNEYSIAHYFGSQPIMTYHVTSKNNLIVIEMGMIVFIVWQMLRNYKTPDSTQYHIQFPFLIHYILLGIELIYFFILGGMGEGDVENRRMLLHSHNILGAFKITSLIFCMTTALLSAQYASLTLESNLGTKREKGLVILTLFLTSCLFLLKDIQFSSRGNMMTLIGLIFAGYTFVKPMNLKLMLKWFSSYGWIVVLTILYIFWKLTVYRTHNNSMTIILESILVKFSSNLAVVHDYLLGDLLVRKTMNSEPITQWINAHSLTWSNPIFNRWDFWPSLKSFFIKYILFHSDYMPGAMHFRIYALRPTFNSANFMLGIVVLGWYGIIAFLGYLYLLRKLIFKSIALQFGLYLYVFYFAFMSFSGMSLFDIPYLLIPFCSCLLLSCFVHEKSSENRIGSVNPSLT